MSEIKKEKVWKAFTEDPEAAAYPGPTQEAIRPTVEKLPEILSDLVDKPLTPSTLMDAKVRVIKYTIDNGVIKALVESMPENNLGFFTKTGLLDMLLKTLGNMLPIFTSIAQDEIKFLEERGITEKDLMMSPDLHLNKEVKEEYLKGQMTVGKLLTMQPMVIIKNDG